MKRRFKTAFWRRIELLARLKKNLDKLVSAALTLTSIFSIALIVYEVGFDLSDEFYAKASKFYFVALLIFFVSFIFRSFKQEFREVKEKRHYFFGVFLR